MTNIKRILLGFVISAVSVVFGASVGVVPAIVSFDFLPPGYTFNMEKKAGTPILIPNDNDVPLVFQVSFEANKPPKSLLPGYENFPDISWCKAIPETVIVQPHDTGRVNLIIEIPNDPQLCNQYWELGVVVSTKRALEMKAGGVQFGIFPSVRGSYLISTLPKEGVNPKSKPTAVVPSAAFISTDEAIAGKKLTFKIFNNDTVPHNYVIEPYEFPHFPKYDVRLAIQNLGDNKPGDLGWISVSKGFLFFKKNTVRLNPGEFAEWTVSVKLPDKPEVRQAPGWDFVVKVLPEGKKEHSGIFRICVQSNTK